MSLITLNQFVLNNNNPESKLIGLFLNTKCSRSAKTLTAYSYEVNNFLFYLNEIPIIKVNYHLLYNYFQQYKNLSPATKAKKICIIRSLFRLLFDIGYLKLNPAVLIEIPKVEVKSQYRYLTKEETTKLIHASKENNRDYLIILLFIYTGIRVDELVNIRLSDFYLDIKGNIGLTICGKGNKTRHVKINQQTWQVIMDYKSFVIPGNSDFLFSTKKGNGITARHVNRILKALCLKAGIKEISPHWLRHTAATLAILGGANIEQIQHSLGHSSINTTQRYLHSVQELDQSICEFIEI